MRYFKVTNDEEVHNGFVYKDGLNIQDAFEDDPNVMGAGFYFTTIDAIPKYYYMGINLRQVHLPENCQCVRMEHKYRSDKLILGKRYSLYDTETYQHFGLKMEDNIHLVNHASETGNIIFLNEWQKNGWCLKFSTDAIDLASANGHIDVLEWWKNSKLKLKFTKWSIAWACAKGRENVLQWWLSSGLEIKCEPKILSIVRSHGHKHLQRYCQKMLGYVSIPKVISTDISYPCRNIIKSGLWVLVNLVMVIIFFYFRWDTKTISSI